MTPTIALFPLGGSFPNCPRASIFEARARDFRIVLAADAVSGPYPRALEEMRHMGILVATAADIASRLTGLTNSLGMA